MVLANPRADVLGVIALIDPARTASEIDLAALEYAATVLSVELGRLQSMAEAELRSQAARERDIAQARAAELSASEARQRAILEAALDAVISIDRRARVTYVNSAFEQHLRVPGWRSDRPGTRAIDRAARRCARHTGKVSPTTWDPGNHASSISGSR